MKIRQSLPASDTYRLTLSAAAFSIFLLLFYVTTPFKSSNVSRETSLHSSQIRANQNVSATRPQIPFSLWAKEGFGSFYYAEIAGGSVYVGDEGILYVLSESKLKNAPIFHPAGPAKLSYQDAMASRSLDRSLSNDNTNLSQLKRIVVKEFASSGFQAKGKDKAGARVTRFQNKDSFNGLKQDYTYNSLSLGEPWPGIEVEVRAYAQNIEKLFRIAPGASVSQISMNLDGVEQVEVTETGELLINTALGTLRLTKPVAYQEDKLGRTPVEVCYQLGNDLRYGFAVGPYDLNRELIIDPMLAGTFLGGSLDERYAYDDFAGHIYTGHPSMVQNGNGDIFVVGHSRSPDYPTTVGVIDSTYNDASSILKNDIVVTKLSSDLSTVIASTYLGGSSEDNAAALAIDSQGDVYILGFTRSRNFPVTGTGFDISYGGGAADGFVAKLSSELTELLAATYIGGSGADFLYGITPASDGSLYLVGDTYSSRFPTPSDGYDLVLDGTNDAFVLKISRDLGTVQKGTFLGGSGFDYGRMVGLNQAGQVVVLGNTTSNNFPTTAGAFDQTQNGEVDNFVTLLSADLGGVVASTLLGGLASDNANSFIINSTNEVVLVGATLSDNLPLTVQGYDKTSNGGADGYVAKLSEDLSTLTALSYFGGSNWEDIYEIKLGENDTVYFAGWTQSPDLPIGSQSYDTSLSGASDAFIGQFSANLNSRLSLSYVGGSGNFDSILSLLLPAGGDLLVFGITDSADFPGMTGAQTTLTGGRDMFIAKVTTDLIADSEANHLVVRDSSGAATHATTAGTTVPIRIEAHDNQGRVVTGFSGNKNVVLEGPEVSSLGTTPTCTNRNSEDVQLGSSTELSFTNGIATCDLKLYKAESGRALDAEIGALSSNGSPAYDLDLDVSASGPSGQGSELSASPAPVTVGDTVSITVALWDAFGNSLGAGAVGQTVVISVGGANSATPAMSYIGGGIYSGTYTPVASGTDYLSGTVNSEDIARDTDSSSNGIFNLPVLPLPLDHYEVRRQVNSSTYSSSFSANVDATLVVAIFAKDSLGNTLTNFNKQKDLIFSGPTASPLGTMPTCAGTNFGEYTPLIFSSGVATCNVFLYNAEVVSIDTTDGLISSISSAAFDLDLNISTSTDNHYEISGLNSQTAGTSQLVTIRAKDYWGNTRTSHNGDKTMVFSGASTSPTGNAPTATNKLGAALPFGQSTVVVFASGVATTTITLYSEESISIDTTDGALNTFDEPAWDLDITVEAGASADPSQCVVSTSANPAGMCGPLGLAVRLYDTYGNALASSSATVAITVVGVNPGTPTVTNEGDGSFTAQYTPVTGGSDVITATVDGVPVGKDTDGLASDGSFNQTIDGTGPNTVTWEGDTSPDWHTANNWVGSVPPTSCSDVIIDGIVAHQPALDLASGSVNINSLVIGPTQTSTLTLTNSNETKLLIVRDDVAVGAQGIITHSGNLLTQLHRLFMDIGGDLNIASGGAIDVTRKGYDYATGFDGSGPGGGAGDNSVGWGGSHGGNGGGDYYSAPDNSNAITYGSIREPSAIGSAGGGGYSLEGGGAIKFVIGGTLTNAGLIKADGYAAGASGGGGAGGSIWLICGGLNNSGEISADGADARNPGDGSGGGGGGRIAIYYDSLISEGIITAYGGNTTFNGETSGTVFLKSRAAANGDLVLDDVNGQPYSSQIPISEDIILDNLSIHNSAGLYINSSLTVMSPVIVTSTWEVTFITIEYGKELNAPNYTGFSDRVTIDRWGTFNGSSSTLTISDGMDWWEHGLLKTIGDTQPVTDIVVEDGGHMFLFNQSPNEITEFNSLAVKAGGEFIAYDTPNYWGDWEIIHMKLGSLLIEQNGWVHAPGWEGYNEDGWGPGGGQGSGSSGSGGGHGGRGGRDGSLDPGAAYGSLQTPFEYGSEGGNGDQYEGNGGGRIKFVVTGTSQIDGDLNVDGDYESGDLAGGAGGSIWLETNILTGTGSISAVGGDAQNAGGGGGGRIALYYQNNSFTGQIIAYGGNSTNSYDGGAGTIYLHDEAEAYGDLVLDNNHNNNPEYTPLATTLTLRNLTIRNGSRLTLLEPYELTVLAASLTTTADSSLTINEGAIVNAPSIANLSNIQIFNFGTYNHSGGTLTVGTGVSWYEDGTSPRLGQTQEISHLVIDGTMWFGNQSEEYPAAFDTITVNSGGVLGARKISQEEPLSPNSPPVAAYNFDENSGASTYDLSENNNDGTLTNATWTTSGKNGSALSFNGSNAYVTVLDAPSLDLTSGMTLSAWVYPTALAGGSYRTVITKETTGDQVYRLYASSAANPRPSGYINPQSGGTLSAFSPNNIPLNTWTYLTTTYDGSALRLYVNGVLAAVEYVSSTIKTSNQPLRIGGNTISSQYYQGIIDDVRIYDRALPESEIEVDMYTPVTSPPPPAISQPTLLNLTATSITVASGGVIDLNGAGYNYTSGNNGGGPAGGEGNGTDGAGGSYGGSGTEDGSQHPTAYGSYYGSIRQPIELGSGGGSCPNVCPGGGAVKLVVAGTLTVDGEIRANGLSSNSIGGGGSGGSVWLDAAVLNGSGVISANGASSSIHGAGGGGRIAIYYGTDSFGGVVTAYGGTDASSYKAGAGTILMVARTGADLPPGPIPTADANDGILIIDNGATSIGSERTYLNESLTVSGLEIRNSSFLWLIQSPVVLQITGNHFLTTPDSSMGINGGAWFRAPLVSEVKDLAGMWIFVGGIELTSTVRLENTEVYLDSSSATWEGLRNLSIGNSATFTPAALLPTSAFDLEALTIENGGMLTHNYNSDVPSSTINIRADTLFVETGGLIDVSRKGYSGGEGPGLPIGNGGAGYGGQGGAGSSGSPGISYGNMARPLDLGSGANGFFQGGGAVLLEISGTATIDGEINADGGHGWVSGGSAGGSILLSASLLKGSGLFSANGGEGAADSGGGGGGRIAIYVFSQTFIPDGGSISVPGFIADPIGGTGLNSGADGTLYFSYADHYQVSGLPSQVSGSSQVIDVQIIDNYGQPFYWNFTRPVIFSGPGQANINGALLSPSWTDRDNNPVVLGQPTNFDFTDGAASSSMTLYKVESASVDVHDGTISSFIDPSYDLDVTVSAQEATLELGSEINASPSVVEINNSVAVTVTVKDQWGNAKTAGGDTVTLAVAGANPQALGVIDNGNGTYSASYTPTVAGIDLITGTLNTKAITGDLDGLSDGTFYVTVTAGAANHLEITGPATVIAGTGYHITIKAVAVSGAVDGSYSGDKQITLSGAIAGPLGHLPTCRDVNGQDIPFGSPTTLEFTLGQATCQMRLYRVGATEVDATDGGIGSTGNTNWDLNTTVNNLLSDGVNGRISATPNPVERNFAVNIYVATFDTYGNALTGGGQTVTLQVTGVNTTTPAVTDLGDGTYLATYTPTNGGQDLITGTLGGLVIAADTDGTSDGVFHETVTATITPTHLEVTGTSSQVARTGQTITITARDDAGDTAFSYSGNKDITLSGPLVAPSGTVPTCRDRLGVDNSLGAVTSLSFTNGQATCSLNLYRVEVTAVDATDGTLSSAGNVTWDLDVAVSSAAASVLDSSLSASPNPGEVAHLVTLQVTVLDTFQNPTTGGETITFAIGGANAQGGLSGTHQGGGIYSASYTPSNPGEDLITAQVNAVAVPKDSDGNSDGTYHEIINAFHLEVTGTATQNAGSSQLITISVRDHNGALNSNYTGNHSLTISGPSHSASGQVPTCQDQSGVFQPLGNGTTLLFTAGQATCLLTLYHSEIVAVDATDGTYSSVNDPAWDLDLVVSSRNGGAIDGTLGASPNPSDRGGLVTVEVNANDEFGNDLPTGTVVNAVVSGGNNTALVLTKTGPRLYRGSYLATNAGEDLITATVAGQAIVKDSDGLSDGIYHLTVRENRVTTHKISGRVYWREPAGEPVKGVQVSNGTRSVLSNGHGNYEIKDLVDGTYTLSGLYEGYEVRVEAGLNPVNVAGSDVRNIDLVVWREAPLTLYAPWNGFLDNVVINEVFNTGSDDLRVTINLYKMSGSQVGRGSETRFVVKPREEIDIIINDLNGFEDDRYGVLVIEMSHGSYSGQVSYYKLTPSGSFRTSEELGEDFDYAFPNPFVAPLTGTSWVTFNTHQPSRNPEDKGYLVPNWLTIINGEDNTSQYFRIRKYDESGKRIEIPDNTGTVSQVCHARKNELRCRVSPLGRIDIDGGHVYPGPERAGLIEIIPENSEGRYVASLVRYGVNSPPDVYSSRYSFGAQLQARMGQGREQVLSVSSAGGAENWVEIANTLNTSVRAQVEVVGYDGGIFYSRNLRLSAHAQIHLNMAEILGENTSGVLRVSADKAGSILAQGASYYLNDEKQVMGVSISQHQDTYGRKVYGTYNRYLNAINWLKIINLHKTKRNFTLLIYREGSEESHTLTLPGYGGFDLPLHNFERFGLAPNTLGMFEIRDSLSSGLSAELLRLKPSSEKAIDFSMTTRLR